MYQSFMTDIKGKNNLYFFMNNQETKVYFLFDFPITMKFKCAETL